MIFASSEKKFGAKSLIIKMLVEFVYIGNNSVSIKPIKSPSLIITEKDAKVSSVVVILTPSVILLFYHFLIIL